MEEVRLEDLLKCLQNVSRIKILRLLKEHGPMRYSDIKSRIEDPRSFPYHMKLLRLSGLIECERNQYRLTKLGREIIDYVDNMEAVLHERRVIPELLVRRTDQSIESFDRLRIVQVLREEGSVPPSLARTVAADVERFVREHGIKRVAGPLLREIANYFLLERGGEEYRHRLTRIGMPYWEVEMALQKEKHLALLEREASTRVLREYVFLRMGRELSVLVDSHLSGLLQLEHVEYWYAKPEVVWHDPRPFFQRGIVARTITGSLLKTPCPTDLPSALWILRLMVECSDPEVSFGHVLDHVNVFLAPFLRKEKISSIIPQIKNFLLDLSLILERRNHYLALGLDPAIPSYMADVEAAGLTKGVAYGDLTSAAYALFKAFLSALETEFLPRIVPFIRYSEELPYSAHRLVSNTAAPVFVTDERVSYSPNGHLVAPDWREDWELDTLRIAAVGSVSINLPRIAYEARGSDADFFSALENCLNLVAKAVEDKVSFLKRREESSFPFLLQHIRRGEPYVRWSNSPFYVELVGLEECSMVHAGTSIAEDRNFAMKVVKHVLRTVSKMQKRRKYRILLSSISSLQASLRFAKIDLKRYGRKKVVLKGEKKNPPIMYTSGPVLSLLDDMSIDDRLYTEALVGRSFSGGHVALINLRDRIGVSDAKKITPVVAERRPTIKAFTYAYVIQHCTNCGKPSIGRKAKCPSCKSTSLMAFGKHSTLYLPYEEWGEEGWRAVVQRAGYSPIDFFS